MPMENGLASLRKNEEFYQKYSWFFELKPKQVHVIDVYFHPSA